MGLINPWKRPRASIHPQPHQPTAGLDDHASASSSVVLTVWRKSLLYCCRGFTVIDSNGDLAYRVDNYINCPGEIILMDSEGKSLHTIRPHKKLGLLEGWRVYDEEEAFDSRSSSKKKQTPFWIVKKQASSIFNTKSTTLAHVFDVTSTDHKTPAYTIEGSYIKRSCKVLDISGNVVAEIRMKGNKNLSASFGLDVFQLVVQSRIDLTRAMTFVVLLDQIFI
ncbi:LURP-one-related 17-like protein [Drosera capensis]